MSSFVIAMEQRASMYASRRGVEIDLRLGFGRDGTVFSTTLSTAVKIHAHRGSYERERRCYERLRDHEVLAVRGFNVPELVQADDELGVIEMTIVRPPYLLDFASAHLDEAPDFPEEVWVE